MHRLPKPNGGTLQELITRHINPDGTPGLPVRELTEALQVSAETLQVARRQPENLSLASLFSLAERLGVTPGEIVVTVFDQIRRQRQASHPPTTVQPRRQRSRPATPEAALNGGLVPEVAPDTTPDLVPANEVEQTPLTAPTPVSQPQPQTEADAFAEDLALKVAYANATLPQRAHALASAQQALSGHFPPLSLAAWAKALDALQPDLWVETEGEPQVTLEHPALEQLLQHLARSKELPKLELTVYSPESLLMARRLAYYSCWAVEALTEIERNPSAYGHCVRDLIFRLASGHSTEQEVLRAFGESIATLNTNGEPRSDDELPGSTSVQARIFRLNWPNGGPGSFRLPPRPPLGPQAGPLGTA
ncbi:hypothetical protein [Hymenobacter psychrophilus]|uniref:hypothetical protein n=1 Tax=Hymenobacter psychrophilus TaxID=651662 RepID=UPI000B8225AF|nr:hypothetical protein [Hymenobacter psychrophilus]